MTLPTLFLLLSSQDARDAAPCVAVSGEWTMNRAGYFLQPADLPPGPRAGHHSDGSHKWEARYDIIWSGDLPALLAAMVAENEWIKQALIQIDALDPEWQGIESISNDAARGLVLRMGEIARQALKGTPQ